MAVGYRNSAGVDFDNLFEPGTTTATGFRRSDGSTLAYAARGSVPKGPNVGFRLSDGTDLSNLWLPKGSAPPVPGFNGQTYSASATAPTGATGTTSAQLRLTLRNDGSWVVERTISGSATGNGTTTIASGTWLPSGGSAADYTVQFAATGTGGTATNGASSASSLATTRSFTLLVDINSATVGTNAGSRAVTTTLTRAGAGSSVATCTLSAEATGQV